MLDFDRTSVTMTEAEDENVTRVKLFVFVKKNLKQKTSVQTCLGGRTFSFMGYGQYVVSCRKILYTCIYLLAN